MKWDGLFVSPLEKNLVSDAKSPTSIRFGPFEFNLQPSIWREMGKVRLLDQQFQILQFFLGREPRHGHLVGQKVARYRALPKPKGGLGQRIRGWSAHSFNAIMDAFAAQSTMSKHALDSERVRSGLKDVLLGPAQLYEALRARGAEGQA